jgi:restriction system protein
MNSPTPVSVSPLFFKGFEGAIPVLINSILKVWWLWVIVLLLIVLFLGFKVYTYYKLSKSGIFEIDKLKGEEFEERLVILFSHLGYKAVRTSMGHVKPDYGADLIIEKDGVKTTVQAKRFGKEPVGEDAVREAFSAKNYYQCAESMVVTTSLYSNMAKTLAKSDNVKLIDRKDLINLLQQEKSSL